jgi:hypothetical protein
MPRITRARVIHVLDSYASLLVLLLANFFLLELIDDPRWGAVGSTLLSAVALVVAIHDPEAGQRITRRHAIQILACVALAPLVLFVNSSSLVGLTYLLPVGLLVTATLPITLSRMIRHPPGDARDRARSPLRVHPGRSPVRLPLPGRERTPKPPVLRPARRARPVGVPLLQAS